MPEAENRSRVGIKRSNDRISSTATLSKSTSNGISRYLLPCERTKVFPSALSRIRGTGVARARWYHARAIKLDNCSKPSKHARYLILCRDSCRTCFRQSTIAAHRAASRLNAKKMTNEREERAHRAHIQLSTRGAEIKSRTNLEPRTNEFAARGDRNKSRALNISRDRAMYDCPLAGTLDDSLDKSEIRSKRSEAIVINRAEEGTRMYMYM